MASITAPLSFFGREYTNLLGAQRVHAKAM
jgi:hypothetical protein